MSRFPTLLLSIGAMLVIIPASAQAQGGNGDPNGSRPPRPQMQPPSPFRPDPPRRPILPPVARPQLALYPGLALVGRPQMFTGSVSDLRGSSIADRALSLRATGRWQVCARTKYRQCKTVSGRVLNLATIGAARRVYSIRYLGR